MKTCDTCGGNCPNCAAVKALREDCDQACRGVERLREALGMSSPDPVPGVLEALADAADHLLQDHDCDRHGWEGISRRARIARQQAAALRAALAEEP